MLLAVDVIELGEEVGAALEEGDVVLAAEVESVAGVRAGHLHAHHVLRRRQMSAWLAVRADLQAGLAVVVRIAVPDGEELGFWHVGLAGHPHEVAEQNEARDAESDVAEAWSVIVLLASVCRPGAGHEGAEADGDEDDPDDLPGGHSDGLRLEA